MFKVVKVLNNNGILAYDMNTRREVIFLGAGVGFGKRPGEILESVPEAKVYGLMNRRKEQPVIKVVNGIDPKILEVTGQLLEMVEKQFGRIDRNVLLPLADHIALTIKRMRSGKELPNPFTADIRVLFSEEFQVAEEGAKLLETVTDCHITEDEIGYIAIHLHSAVSDDNVGQSLDLARLARECICLVEEISGYRLKETSMGYSRLMSHIRYMLVRIRNGEKIPLDVEDYVKGKFSKAYDCASVICRRMEQELSMPVYQEEVGFLGLHIQRVWGDE